MNSFAQSHTNKRTAGLPSFLGNDLSQPAFALLTDQQSESFLSRFRVFVSPKHFTNTIGVGPKLLNDVSKSGTLLAQYVCRYCLIKREVLPLHGNLVEFDTRRRVNVNSHLVSPYMAMAGFGLSCIRPLLAVIRALTKGHGYPLGAGDCESPAPLTVVHRKQQSKGLTSIYPYKGYISRLHGLPPQERMISQNKQAGQRLKVLSPRPGSRIANTVRGLAVRLCTAPQNKQAGQVLFLDMLKNRLGTQQGRSCVPVYASNAVAHGLLDPLPLKRGRVRALSLGSFEGVEGPHLPVNSPGALDWGLSRSGVRVHF